jgi:N-acetylmuramoyl-L-alanine amidase
MPDNSDIYWDEPVPADDDFELHTFDTGAFDDSQDARTGSPGMEDADDDEFSVVTVEPQIAARSTAPALSIPLQRRTVVARPQPHRRRVQKPPSLWLSMLRTIMVVVAAAVLVSTIFSLWTRPTFFSEEFRAGLNRVQATQHVINIQPTPLPTETREVRIGIVAGHSGPPEDPNFDIDPGATCPDGLTELSINEAVARKAVAALQREGYTVDLLQEFDPRLVGYQADVLVSIHSNDCQDYGDAGTGFAVAAASSRQTTRGEDEYLLNCMVNQYGATTGLPHHQGLTFDMTDYHTFSEVTVDTPTAIIELGFMRNDRTMLTQQQDLLAQGVANGVRCFLRPDLYGAANTPGQQ